MRLKSLGARDSVRHFLNQAWYVQSTDAQSGDTHLAYFQFAGLLEVHVHIRHDLLLRLVGCADMALQAYPGEVRKFVTVGFLDPGVAAHLFH